MKKYRVNYSGFAYIYADDIGDAKTNFDRDDAVFDEYSVDSIQEVDEFIVGGLS